MRQQELFEKSGFPFAFAQTAMQQAMQGMTRCNVEVMNLMRQRTQAYLELPKRLAECKGPQEVLSEQMKFWQTAAEDLQTGSRRIMAAWSESMPQLSNGNGSTPIPRDHITFQDPADQAPLRRDPLTREPPHPRRSAA
jgi:hypothetical protein